MQFFKKINALGTGIEIWLNTLDDSKEEQKDFEKIEKQIFDFEQSFSRFIEDNELNRLNKSRGNFKASPEMIKILKLAKEFYVKTNKIFDPTIATTLERLGYDKSYNEWIVKEGGEIPHHHTDEIGFDKITIDEASGQVNIPPEIKIDLGGIGKGYIVDIIAKDLISAGYKNFWISAGGDMFLSGKGENEQFHQVGIQNPLKHSEDLLNIEIKGETLAVATSGITKRHWSKAGKNWHHIIDPKTGLSTQNDLLSVIIISENTVEADVFAKTVFILGKEKGVEFINNQNKVEGLIIDKDLNTTLSKNMINYLI